MPVKIRAVNAEDIPTLVPLITQLGYTLNEQQIADNLTAIRQRGGEVLSRISKVSVVLLRPFWMPV